MPKGSHREQIAGPGQCRECRRVLGEDRVGQRGADGLTYLYLVRCPAREAPAQAVRLVQSPGLQSCRRGNSCGADHHTALPAALLQVELAEARQVANGRKEAGMAADTVQSIVGVAVVDLTDEKVRAPAIEAQPGAGHHALLKAVTILGGGHALALRRGGANLGIPSAQWREQRALEQRG